jgi:ABC-type phosphate transport system substrate-binding protein
MITSNLKAKLAKAAACAAAVGVVAGTVLATTGPASADPPSFSGLTGVGSDTTQDVLNALSGFNQGTIYTPVFSDSNPRQTITSFDALPPAGVSDGCITTKLKAGSFVRPNGSGGGQRALSRALDGTNFGPSTNSLIVCSEPAKPLTGLVDFARSSSPPSATPGTVLQFIPFARDGLSYAYVRPSGSPVTTLTRAELTAAYTNTDPVNNPTLVGGVPILPCGIQTSSGTFGSWNTAVAASTTQENTATQVCRAIDTATDEAATGRIQENAGNQLNDKANLLASFDPDGPGPLAPGAFANAQVIVGFSASNFVAQTNGVVSSQLPSPAGTVDLGAITNGATALGKPYTGSVASPPIAANAAFYNDSVFGREVFNVVSYSRIRSTGSTGMKELFISTGATAPGVGEPGRGLPANFTAVICRTGPGSPQATVQTFGFLSLPASRCGTVSDNTLTAPSRSGTF